MFLRRLDKPALIFQDRVISHAELIGRSATWAAARPVGAGERVLIYAENSLEWVFAFYAAWRQRAIVVPVDCMCPPDDVAYIINDCQPTQAWTSRRNQAALQEALAKAEFQPRVCLLEEGPEGFDPGADFIEENPEDIAVLIYTSGTTGSPKGVMLTYRNLLTNIKGVEEAGIYTSQDRVLVLLPLHHILPLQGTMTAPLHAGATCIFSPSLQGEDIIATLQKHKITMMIGVPRLYTVIAKGIRDKINANRVARILYRLAAIIDSPAFSRKVFKKVHDRLGGCMKAMVCGGAALDEGVARTYRALGFEVLMGFGMTETSPIITFTRLGGFRLNSSGQALPGVDIKVEEGEICARGGNVMKGYWNRPEETAQVLKDGWIYTGDLGHLDKDGFIFITGRKKEIIVLANGKNINPVEIESKLLAASPLIAEAGVFLLDDILQCVILPDFAKVGAAGILNLDEHFRWEVIAKVNREVAPYKKLMKFTIVKTELPKTRLGKLRRFALPEMVKLETGTAKQERHDGFREFDEYSAIKDFIVGRIERPVWPDDHIEIDLGMDSLDKVALQVFVKDSYGVELVESELIETATVLKIAEMVRSRKVKSEVEAIDWGRILREKFDSAMPRRWFTQTWFRFAGSCFLHLYFRFHTEGEENLPDTPCIITPNHQSFLDGLMVASAMPRRQFRNTCFYAKAKHVRRGWVKFIAARNNVIVSDVNKDLKVSIQKIAEAIRSGKNVVIFPEGTRTRDGQVGQFKELFAILSRELNVPIVPVAIHGAFEALPHGSRIPRPWKPVTVKILPAVHPGELSYEALRNQVRDIVSTAVEGLGRR